jgi:outer membrane protein TolC
MLKQMTQTGSRVRRRAAPRRVALVGTLIAAALVPAACTVPYEPTREKTLRQAMIAEHKRRLDAMGGSAVRRIEREPSEVEQELTSKRRQQLDQMSGPEAYTRESLDMGSDLLGNEKTDTVKLSLQRAVELAVRHNLQLQQGRLAPAIARAEQTNAEAQFDALLFAEANYEKRDTPRPGGTVAGLAEDQTTETVDLRTGIRKPLTTGGQISAEARLNRERSDPSLFDPINKFYDSDVLFQLEQPLLRNFGTDVNTARIRLAENARASDVQALKSDILDRVLEVEQAYWQLLLTQRELQIQRQLLQRTIEDRDRLKAREGFDVSPVRLTEANSFVERRRSTVIRTRQNLRRRSDELKRLLNAPSLPLAGETLVLPVETPIEQPIDYNLVDAVTEALQKRPVLKQALLEINDASIRQRVADNQRLPQLDLNAAVGFNGLGVDDGVQAFEQNEDLNFIDYVLGASFEYPIGNRGPEAEFTRRRLERRQSVLAYRDQAQQVVLDVKNALREMVRAYELIGSTRAARRAAADSLRAIEEQEQAGAALTPEFLLDLKLDTQRRLAEAQIAEVQATVDYNTAIAAFYRAMGTLLDRNGITFEPTSE